MYVVPRQIVEMGDPSRRSCDACESLGARFKKIIKHLTCRRVIIHQNKDVVSKRQEVYIYTCIIMYLLYQPHPTPILMITGNGSTQNGSMETELHCGLR